MATSISTAGAQELQRDSNPYNTRHSLDWAPVGSMAIGACPCSARKLFAGTIFLYLCGFLFLVGVWDRTTGTLEDTKSGHNLAERNLKFADGREDADDASYHVVLPGAVKNVSKPEGVSHQATQALQIDNVVLPEADDIQNPTLITKPQWEVQQQQRRSQLTQTCRKLSNRPPFNTNISTIMQNHKRQLWPFIVNDKYRLMYCYISKVGSTHWKMAFLVLQGKYKRVEDVPGSRAHDPSLKKLNSYKNVDEISRRLDNYTTFIFVRNPFARVISGYRSKLLQNNPSFHKSVGRTIVKRYRKNPTAEELKGHDVSFPEFVKYLTDPLTKNLDGHWKPMYQMVLPCSVRFDYIGKLETAEEDATYILQNTHVDDLIHFKQTQRNVSHDQATFDRYFAEVPHADVKKLYDMYYPDFALFGYELPEYMKSWVL